MDHNTIGGQQPLSQQPGQNQSMPQQSMPQQTMPQQSIPQQSMPQQPMSQQPMPQQPIPHQPMPQQPMPRQPIPQRPMQYQPMPQQPMPKQSAQKPTKKKGRFAGILIGILAIVLLLGGTITALVIVRKNQVDTLRARFEYDDVDSAEMKLAQAYCEGEIDADTYLMQLTYSVYEPELLMDEYRSDCDYDMVPNIEGIAVEHIDELSEETVQYVCDQLMSVVCKIGPDASQNPQETAKSNLFTLQASAKSQYNITTLDKAVLSPKERYIVYYTTTGLSAMDKDDVEEIAASIDEVTDSIETYMDMEWSYTFHGNDIVSTFEQLEVLKNCNIDTSMLNKAMPVYLINIEEEDEWYASYTKYPGELLRVAMMYNFRVVTGCSATALYSYTYPLITVRNNMISKPDEMAEILAHEITHHFQYLEEGDLNYQNLFPYETQANLAAINAVDVDMNYGVRKHVDYYMRHTELIAPGSERKSSKDSREEAIYKASGYSDVPWMLSYIDTIDNGQQIFMEACRQDNPAEYLEKQAGDKYMDVLEDLAVRNLTKEYNYSALKTKKVPKEGRKLDLSLDSYERELNRNGLSYYYLDRKELCDNLSKIYMTSENDNMFVKVMARRGVAYDVLDTFYPDANSEILVIDGADERFPRYNEIILIIGAPGSKINEKVSDIYKLSVASQSTLEAYEEFTGTESPEVYNIDGECITLYVDELIEAGKKLTDSTMSLVDVISDNIDSDSEEGQIMSQQLDAILLQLGQFGVDLDAFGENFPYETIRIYTMPINSTKTTDELHNSVLSTVGEGSKQVFSFDDEGSKITVGAKVQIFKDPGLTFVTLITTDTGESVMYKVEFSTEDKRIGATP